MNLLLILDGARDGNQITKLQIITRLDDHGNKGPLLWQVLSHPYCKITDLHLEEDPRNGFGAFGTMSAVRRWCQTVRPKSPRTLGLVLYSVATTDKAFNNLMMTTLDDLRRALQSPNNGVYKLVLFGGFSDWRFCELALKPILQDPHNVVTDLVLICTCFLNSEAKALTEALASPNLKLRAFRIAGPVPLTFDEATSLLAGLEVLPCLERLAWSVRTERHRLQPDGTSYPLNKEEKHSFISHLTRLMVKPGNILRSIRLTNEEWDADHASMVAAALASEHCRVEELRCELGANQTDANLIITDAIFRSNNRIKVLELSIRDEDRTAEIFEKHLQNSACKLESLAIPFRGQRTALVIAKMLEVPNSSRLRVLDVGRQSSMVFLAFTKSLRSHHNNLRVLHLYDDGALNERMRRDFYCALRISNVTDVRDALRGPYYPFTMAFNDPFFLVLHALLSIKQFPRLGQFTWIRVLPLQDFILRIANTLGWPLDDLRAPFDRPAWNGLFGF